MPRRFLADEIRTSKSAARLSSEARVLMDNLITVADDYGLFEADPLICCANAFPRPPVWLKGGPEQVSRLLQELSTPGTDGDPALITIYEADGRIFGAFGRGWRKTQGSPRSKRPRFPTPPPPNSSMHAGCTQVALRLNANALASASASASASAFGSIGSGDKPSAPATGSPGGMPAGEGEGPVGEQGASRDQREQVASQSADSTRAAASKKPLRHITAETPPEDLDAPDRCRRRFAIEWKNADRHNGAQYPDQPEKDRKAVSSLLSYHRRNKLSQPWKEWMLEVFTSYLSDNDSFLTSNGHPLCLIPSRLPAIVAKMAKEAAS